MCTLDVSRSPSSPEFRQRTSMSGKILSSGMPQAAQHADKSSKTQLWLRPASVRLQVNQQRFSVAYYMTKRTQ